MVRCPHCDIDMNPVRARANPGSLIELDQCAQCGGIWCDKWELFPIEPDEAAKIEPVDQELLRSPVPIKKTTLYCPRCTARLASSKDPVLGADIQLQRCFKCEGIWLNRGQFSLYKAHQKKTRTAKMGPAKAVKKISQVYQHPKSWVVTGTKGMFVHPHGVDENRDLVEKTMSGGFKLALQTLVRLVLGI